MNYIFDINYIKGNELLFWIYVLSMLLIIIITIIFVKRALKDEHK